MQVPEVIMQVPGSENAGPGNDILWLELMSEVKETLLEKKKANGTMLGSNFILAAPNHPTVQKQCRYYFTKKRYFTHINTHTRTL